MEGEIVVAPESMDVIQEQTYVPEPPSQPQIQTKKQSKPQSEKSQNGRINHNQSSNHIL